MIRAALRMLAAAVLTAGIGAVGFGCPSRTLSVTMALMRA